MKAFRFVFGIVVFAMLAGQGFAAEGDKASKLATRLKSEEDCHAAVEAVMNRRKAIIEVLIGTVKEKIQANPTSGAAESAVRLLGLLRAKEAIPVLIKNIDFLPDFIVVDEPREIIHPCVEALVEIGSPAAKDVLMRLPSSTKKRLPLYLRVMRDVWGKDVCLLILKEKLKTKLTVAEKANLQTAIDHPMFKEGYICILGKWEK